MMKYDDIIHLPHHQSSTRPHMSLYDRAAQFSPFAALTGYEEAIEETARLTDEELVQDEDLLSELNDKIVALQARISSCPSVTVTYFQPDEKKAGGKYVAHTGNVKKIDGYNRRLLFTDGTQISFSRIVAIEGDRPRQTSDAD